MKYKTKKKEEIKMYEIEKNIPIIGCRWKRERKYPFLEMEVGDSFFVPLKEKEIKRKRNAIMSAAHHYRNRKFLSRIISSEKDAIIGLRFWRVKKKQKGR
jgi:hypothetical protein